MADAPLVIALGPGFVAGRDCHFVVETQRGHHLGRVYSCGEAAPDSGLPGSVGGQTVLRLLRAPCSGVFEAAVKIGDRVRAGESVGTVGGQPVLAAIAGTVRGLLWTPTAVCSGLKIGDVDPRSPEDFDLRSISDKARAVAGGVIEAILSARQSPRGGLSR